MSDNDEKNKSGSFLLKIESIRKQTLAFSMYLKPDDVIVALNNEVFTFGEELLTEKLNDVFQEGKKSLLTIYRNNTFFDIVVPKSLGCKFSTTSKEETQEVQNLFLKKKITDLDELKEYTVMRDLRNNYEFIEKSNSVLAGLFPPAWLAYEQKWWVLSFFTTLCFLLLSINTWAFLIGWLIICIYCYKAQINLMLSFSALSGKAFSMKIATKDIHEAQKTIRELNPKAKFKYSKLEDPVKEEDQDENKKLNNNVAEDEKALV